MSDDYGTVSAKRGDRAREIEVLRQHYRAHRDALSRMIGDAPTEQLASEYQRLIGEIDGALRKLDELEGRAGAPATATGAASAALAETQRMRSTSAGNRPLVTPAVSGSDPGSVADYDVEPGTPVNASSRMLLMAVIAIVVLAAIGWLIWRASSDRKTTTAPVIEQPVGSTSIEPAAPASNTIAPAPSATSPLKIVPAVADYGVIRKGTRAVRQFELTNTGTTPIAIEVARSTCRCLYYDYNGKVPPKGKENITVTVDGARAKAGVLEEQLAVTSKSDPTVTGSLGIRALIK